MRRRKTLTQFAPLPSRKPLLLQLLLCAQSHLAAVPSCRCFFGLLAGVRVSWFSYEIEMKVPDACKILCKKNHNKADMRLFRSIIDDEYRIDWIVDNLPGAMRNDE